MSSNDKNVLKQLLVRQTRFNVWANELIADACGALPDSIVKRDFGGSFPSLEATLMHIWYAENVWLGRLNGLNPDSPSRHDFGGSISKICRGITVQSKSYVQYALNSEDDILTRSITYHNLSGVKFEHSPEQIIAHVINHSSYHRGQVINYLRQAGVNEVPSTDLIRYLRTVS